VKNRNGRQRGLGAFLHATGWIGVLLLMGAGYFATGAIVALFNWELILLFQTVIVSALLVLGALLIANKRKKAASG
jgi:hypothetical protein